jgi:hypothetical protein
MGKTKGGNQMKKWFSGLILTACVGVMIAFPALVLADTIPGDANGDGRVSVGDITKVERIILGWDEITPGADADQNGDVNMGDVVKVERIILGLN